MYIKCIVAIISLSAMAHGYDKRWSTYYGQGTIFGGPYTPIYANEVPSSERCIFNFDVVIPSGGEMKGSMICVVSRSGTPLHFGYVGNGVFLYDEAGFIYPAYFLAQQHPQIEEFNYGVH